MKWQRSVLMNTSAMKRIELVEPHLHKTSSDIPVNGLTDMRTDGQTDISNIPRGVGGQRTRLEQHHKNKYQQQQQQMHCNKLVANAKKNNATN